jgi:predicted metalloprotease
MFEPTTEGFNMRWKSGRRSRNVTQRARNMLESGDLEEALNAATAIGDDRIQRESTGRVVPDSFTHGSSAQRVKWFRVGFESGDVAACDTFRVAQP